MDEYDPRTNCWTARLEMPLHRDAYRVASVGEKIYVLGNLNGSTETLEFDPASNSWKIKAAMPTPRFDFGIVAFRGLIYTFGGMGKDTLEAYDPERDLWIRKRPMARDNWEQVAAESLGKILVVGGGFQPGYILDTVFQYDPLLDPPAH